MTNQGPLAGGRETIAIACGFSDTPALQGAIDLLTTEELTMFTKTPICPYEASMARVFGMTIEALTKTGKEVHVYRIGARKVHTNLGKKRKSDIKEYRVSSWDASQLEYCRWRGGEIVFIDRSDY